MRHVVRWWAAPLALALLGAPAVAEKKPERQARPSLTIKNKGGRAWPTKRRVVVGIVATEINDELQVHFGAPRGVGLLVSHVKPKSPAKRAGVHVGDVLVELDSRKMRSIWDVVRAIRGRKKGDRVKLSLIRDRKPLTLEATLDVRKVPQVEIGHLLTFRVPSLAHIRKAMEQLQKQMPGQLRRLQAQEGELKRRLREMERKLHRLERNLNASP